MPEVRQDNPFYISLF